jgi:Zinc finger, C2H2 type
MEFRDKCLKNDEKLRLIFKVNVEEEAREQEAIQEAMHEEEPIEEEDEEVITLNPNNLYESSDESDSEHPEEQIMLDHQNAPPTSIDNNPQPERVPNASNAAHESSKKEIFHCKYCDVVFSEPTACNLHEQKSHDQTYPYECVICSYKTDQQATLIFHIKQTHNFDKPFLCTQCNKSFIRRSDLRKHTFVHAGKFKSFHSSYLINR